MTSPSSRAASVTASPLTSRPLREPQSTMRAWSADRTISAWVRETDGSSRRTSAAVPRPISVMAWRRGTGSPPSQGCSSAVPVGGVIVALISSGRCMPTLSGGSRRDEETRTRLVRDVERASGEHVARRLRRGAGPVRLLAGDQQRVVALHVRWGLGEAGEAAVRDLRVRDAGDEGGGGPALRPEGEVGTRPLREALGDDPEGGGVALGHELGHGLRRAAAGRREVRLRAHGHAGGGLGGGAARRGRSARRGGARAGIAVARAVTAA